jgi:hypothetical protein
MSLLLLLAPRGATLGKINGTFNARSGASMVQKSVSLRILRYHNRYSPILSAALAIILLLPSFAIGQGTGGFIGEERLQALISDYAGEHGETERARFERGARQVAMLWQEGDGTPAEYEQFCRENFIADTSLLRRTTERLERASESIENHLGRLGRDLYWHLSVETGPLLPIDEIIARYSPYTHLQEDLFQTQLAFVVLLNYPLCTLEELLEKGSSWTREEWVGARMAADLAVRVPAEANRVMQEARLAGGNYIRDYNIWMHHLLDEQGNRLFPEGMRLISHWNLRDELKALYAEPDGLVRQEMIYEVMLKIIRQEIPQAVINNPGVDWHLATNLVTVSPVLDGPVPAGAEQSADPGYPVDNSPEPDTRYERWLGMFRGHRALDKHYPMAPSLIERRFQLDREMPEPVVESLLVSILSADVMVDIGNLISKRLNRPLRPFDIWYDGFKARSAISEDTLDAIVKAKYPTPEAFEADMLSILTRLGFDDSLAQYLASRIELDPARGVGHAAAPAGRDDNAHLRTRVGADGMDYKGYNIAMHEFGHNVEQVISTCLIDHSLLRGVPNTAFTEAFAFVFQARDLEMLGIATDDPVAEHLQNLDDLWGAYEISAVSLVDMRVWRWLYAHPEATPAELKAAVTAIAREVWNTYCAPVFGVRDVELLAIYSHLVTGSMYIPDYAIGSVIAFQIEDYLKSHDLGPEMVRTCKLGSITPELWMQQAVGAGVSSEPMLAAARQAVAVLDTE